MHLVIHETITAYFKLQLNLIRFNRHAWRVALKISIEVAVQSDKSAMKLREQFKMNS